MKFIFLDAEMGGRELKYSLLTLCLMVTDENATPLEPHLNLKIKPDDGDYIVSGQGMSVNKINIAEHDKVAIPYKLAKPLLYNFLHTHGKDERLVPVGHAVKGDIEFVTKYLISRGSWEQFCTYHFLDTSVILQFLRAKGKMPMDIDVSVEALASYFKVDNILPQRWHEADYDTLMTARVFHSMLKL